MTITHPEFTARMRAASEYMTEHGWAQGTEQGDDGAVCMTGAVRYCQPRTGDEYLIREVLRRRQHAETWNDTPGRLASECVTYLATAPDITDSELAECFGPQWEAIVALVRRAAVLTEAEALGLNAARAAARAAAGVAARDAAWDAAGVAARVAARDAAWDAARAAAGDAAWDAARDAARAAAWDAARAAAGVAARVAARDAAWDAAGDAARALVVRDLIGRHGFTQEHYDLLTGPWAKVIGPVHPDDSGAR